MTLRHFRIFNVVYQEQNMTAAARKLFMTQPSVSQAVKELENHYQVVLFERFPQKLYPTAAGDRLYEYATHILEELTELDDAMTAGSSQRILRIGSNDTVGSSLLDGYIRSFHKEHPEAELQVMINKTSLLTDMLRTNDLDFLLTDEFKSAPDVTSLVIGQDHFVPAVGASHPLANQKKVTLEDLSSTHLLLRERGTDARDHFDQLMTERGLHIEPYWESISFDNLLHAALVNVGVAILPENSIEKYLKSKELVKLSIPEIDYPRTLVLAHQRNKYITPQMADFFKICTFHSKK